MYVEFIILLSSNLLYLGDTVRVSCDKRKFLGVKKRLFCDKVVISCDKRKLLSVFISILFDMNKLFSKENCLFCDNNKDGNEEKIRKTAHKKIIFLLCANICFIVTLEW